MKMNWLQYAVFRIRLWAGFALARRLGQKIEGPNILAYSWRGNLYVKHWRIN